MIIFEECLGLRQRLPSAKLSDGILNCHVL